MNVINSNFGFTVKVGEDHFAGHFNYHQNGAELVKMSYRRLPKKKDFGIGYEKVAYLRNVNGKWLFWDVLRKAPKRSHEGDNATYAIFKEAFGLALLNEA